MYYDTTSRREPRRIIHIVSTELHTTFYARSIQSSKFSNIMVLSCVNILITRTFNENYSLQIIIIRGSGKISTSGKCFLQVFRSFNTDKCHVDNRGKGVCAKNVLSEAKFKIFKSVRLT